VSAIADAPAVRSGRALNGSVRVLAWILSLAALALPAYAYYRSAQPPSEVAGQVRVPPAPPAQVATLPASVELPAGVPVLAYGEVADQPSPWSVTPKELDAQLASLRASGFHAISAAQLTRWLRGDAALPTRPVLLTFDGATKSSWRYADPMLARYGQRATVLPVTGRVGTHQPYYLNWPELRRMHASGRWDVGSNTHGVTGDVLVNPAGRARNGMTNLRWLRKERRRESLGQFRGRISRDLDGSIAELTRHGLPRPAVFAFPHSVEDAAPNDGRVPDALLAVTHRRFAAVLDTVRAPVFNAPAARSAYLRRIDIGPGTSGAALLESIVHAARRTREVQP
jgi:hypothetical protein